MLFDDLVTGANDLVWSLPLVGLLLLTGLYFSVRTRFIQLRALPDMLRLMFRHERSDAGVSPFQALSLSLSSRVGVGNIAGVAMAIAFGGPGAILRPTSSQTSRRMWSSRSRSAATSTARSDSPGTRSS